MRKKLINNWKSKTPKIAQFLQVVSGALAAIPIYYQSLPEEFKATLTTNTLQLITFSGLLIAFLLQFFKTKETK